MIRFTSIAKHSLILLASALVAACGGGGGGGGLGSSNQAPVFSSGSGSVTTPENNTGVIYTAQASDPDGSIVGFYLSGGEDQDDFSIDALSGNLRFNEGQDRENPTDANYDGIYVVEISVSDTGGAVSSMSLSVSLSDVDEAPIITAGQTLSVDENSAAGTAVGSATATNDGISVGLQNWRLVEDGSDGLFVVDSDGAITVAEGAVLNHERADGVAGGNSYTLGLKVSDGKFISSVGDVVINIADVNEPPVIEAGKVFEVYEDSVVGAEVGYAVATDVDSADADVGKWTITDSSAADGSSADGLFDISPSNGQITLAQDNVLDYESAIRSYTLTLTVSDQEYTSAEETVQINVTDANDNKPTINNPEEASFSIDEGSAIGAQVGAQITAEDVDTNTVYQDWAITGGNTGDVFGINSVESDSGEIVGEIVVAEYGVLDVDAADAIKSYDLEITVGDGANTSDPITVTVDINGVNDEIPVIGSGQSFKVDENATSVSASSDATCVVDVDNDSYPDSDASQGFIGKLEVADADADTNLKDWAMVSDSSDGGFCIDPNSGYIYVADSNKLDYETNTIHELNVTVEDGIHKSEEVIVDINLTDVNDELPVVESGLSFAVDENASDDTVVGTVSASDGDVGLATDYQNWTITDGNTGNAFSIVGDGVTATIEVKTSAVLDYQPDSSSGKESRATTSYSLKLTVSDGVNTSSEQTVQIDINNVNDEQPVVMANDFSIAENSSAGTLVGQVTATDGDIDHQSTQETWQIVGGNDNYAAAFTIDNSGNITVAADGQLDFESTESYELNLTVSDDVQTSAEQTVEINLNDINEPPTARVSAYFEDNLIESIITVDDEIELNASESTDPEGVTLNYSWTQPSGQDTKVHIVAGSGSYTEDSFKFTASIAGEYSFTLTVSDGEYEDNASLTVYVDEYALPTDFSASTGDYSGQVELTWTEWASAYYPESEGVIYNIYRNEDVNCLPPISCTGSASELLENVSSPYVDNGLTNGTTYYYLIEARATAGSYSDITTNAQSAMPMGALNDTGVTWNVASTAVIDNDCVINVSNGDPQGQDCVYGRDASDNNDSDGAKGFSFTRFDNIATNTENDGSDTENSPWSCIRDNVTGLVWQYSYADASGDQVSFSDAESNVNTANNDALCGLTNWRIPSVDELYGLIDLNTSMPLDSDYFLFFAGYKYNDFWASNVDVTNSSNYWRVRAAEASLSTLGSTNKQFSILVSSSDTSIVADWSDSRYIVDKNNGTVTDIRTGLMWDVCTYGMSYSSNSCSGTAQYLSLVSASELAEGAEDYNGYSDWRLPNAKELLSIVDFNSATAPTINSAIFPNTPSSLHLSSSSVIDNIYGKLLLVKFGSLTNKIYFTISDNAYGYVRLVRSVRD